MQQTVTGQLASWTCAVFNEAKTYLKSKKTCMVQMIFGFGRLSGRGANWESYEKFPPSSWTNFVQWGLGRTHQLTPSCLEVFGCRSVEKCVLLLSVVLSCIELCEVVLCFIVNFTAVQCSSIS